MKDVAFRYWGLCGVLIIGAIGQTAYAAPISFSNGVYQVAVEDSTGPSIGSWSAATDVGHPTGSGNDLLFFENSSFFRTDTNFSSLRVFGGSGVKDYHFGLSGGAISLDPFFFAEGPSPILGIAAGRRTEWNLTPESLFLTQDVVIAGNSFSNSAIYHTIEIQNIGPVSTSVGWRNLYDWQTDDPGTDDGPSNEIENDRAQIIVPQTGIEFSHIPGFEEFVRVAIFPDVEPTYESILMLDWDPQLIPSLPLTTPDEYAYVSWRDAVGTSFDYVPTGQCVGGPLSVQGCLDDSAGLSWFGRDVGTAIALNPGELVRFTQIIVGEIPGQMSFGKVSEPYTLALFAVGLTALGFIQRPRRPKIRLRS